MGRQVRFYAFPGDEVLFLAFARSIPGTNLITRKSSNRCIKNFIIPWNEEHLSNKISDLYLCDVNPKSLKNYLRKGSYHVYSEEKMDYIDTGQKFFFMDDMSAPLVEFSPSFFRDDGRLAQGRI